VRGEHSETEGTVLQCLGFVGSFLSLLSSFERHRSEREPDRERNRRKKEKRTKKREQRKKALLLHRFSSLSFSYSFSLSLALSLSLSLSLFSSAYRRGSKDPVAHMVHDGGGGRRGRRELTGLNDRGAALLYRGNELAV
jgi:hypothetical protein